jgi:type II restriction/modification system DNA methylase subunit YeeA
LLPFDLLFVEKQFVFIALKFVNVKDKNQYDIELQAEIIKLVDQLLQVNEAIQTVTLESKREQLQNKIEYCENRVNDIVYQLYGLTDEEINMVESI